MYTASSTFAALRRRLFAFTAAKLQKKGKRTKKLTLFLLFLDIADDGVTIQAPRRPPRAKREITRLLYRRHPTFGRIWNSPAASESIFNARKRTAHSCSGKRHSQAINAFTQYSRILALASDHRSSDKFGWTRAKREITGLFYRIALILRSALSGRNLTNLFKSFKSI